MRVLVGWDDAAESETIRLYLNVDGSSAVVCRDAEEFIRAADTVPFPFDIVLLATALPDYDAALRSFRRLRAARPECPVVGVCRSDDVYRLGAFLRGGMRATLPRDVGGDFVFLVRATLEATLDAVRAEQDQNAARAMRRELESVRQIQSAVLPQAVPQPAGYRIVARYEPSRIEVTGGDELAIGGDYHDVIRPDERHTTILVADATGHGLRACLSMIALDALLRVLPVPRFLDPAGLLADLNRLFCRQRLNRLDGGFVTALCAVLRHDRHVVRWAAAGHPPPVLEVERNAGPVARAAASGPPLGVDDAADYPEETVAMPPGGRLMLFSDGISEAGPRRRGRMFGAGGVSAVLAETAAEPAEGVMDRLFAAAERFSAPDGLTDDATAVLLERAGRAGV